MRFTYHVLPQLPRLAWCALMKQGQGEVHVFHGEWLETRAEFFIDGAWDGPLAGGDLDRSCCLMGTGARIRNDRVVFCSPCHTLERLHFYQDGEQLLVSPSMVFILAAAGRALDGRHATYQADLMYFVQKLANHVGSVPLAGRASLDLVHYRNVVVDDDLRRTILAKPMTPEFADFAAYRKFLTGSLQAIAANAGDPARTVKYRPVVMLSSGYDSTACAALSTEIGCREALTFRKARAQGRVDDGQDDSGKAIGEKLGLAVKEFDRHDYWKKSGFPEAEFVASGDLGQDLVIASMEDELRQRFVLVGCHGDRLWDRHAKRVKRDVLVRNSAACSWTEFRTRVGFFCVAPAYFACLSHPSLYRISNSPEMAPWTLGTHYDRPIPRRLAEEKGVDRHLFGTRKKAVTVLLNREQRLAAEMKPESYASFDAFFRAHRGERSAVAAALYALLFRAFLLYYWCWNKLRIPFRFACPIPMRFRGVPGRPSFLAHWGFEHTRERYAACRPAP